MNLVGHPMGLIELKKIREERKDFLDFDFKRITPLFLDK